MADSIRNDLLNVVFSPGELPTGHKLTQAFTQVQAGIEKIGRAIGDIYSQQGDNVELTTPPLVGPNLGRLVGSSGALNPEQVARVRSTVTVLYEGAPFTTSSSNPYSYQARTELRLPYPPLYYESPSTVTVLRSYTNPSFWSITGAGAAAFTNLVPYLEDLATLGDYHVSDDGTITSYTGLANGQNIEVEYTFDLLPEYGINSTWSVIPDFIEDTTLCSVSLVSGSTYEIVLPVVTQRGLGGYFPAGGLSRRLGNTRRNDHLCGWVNIDNSAMATYQTVLPVNLVALLGPAVDKTIPGGYIQLYDEVADSILSGGVWTYVNASTVRVTGLTLEEGTARYRVIVPGTNITEVVTKLAHEFRCHSHSPRGSATFPSVLLGERILHADLLGLYDQGTDTEWGFVPSSIGPLRNPHTQYLHRYGYRYDIDGLLYPDHGNFDNAFLGHFVLSKIDRSLSALNDDSFSIYFGRFGAGSGGRIRYNHSGRVLELSEQDVKVTEDLKVNGFIHAKNKVRWLTGTGMAAGAGVALEIIITGAKRPDGDDIQLQDILGASCSVEGDPLDSKVIIHGPSGSSNKAYVSEIALTGSTMTVTVALGVDHDAGRTVRVIVWCDDYGVVPP